MQSRAVQNARPSGTRTRSESPARAPRKLQGSRRMWTPLTGAHHPRSRAPPERRRSTRISGRSSWAADPAANTIVSATAPHSNGRPMITWAGPRSTVAQATSDRTVSSRPPSSGRPSGRPRSNPVFAVSAVRRPCRVLLSSYDSSRERRVLSPLRGHRPLDAGTGRVRANRRRSAVVRCRADMPNAWV